MTTLVLGSGLDAILYISNLIKNGTTVTHFAKSKILGGHFRGLKTNHGYVDAGMVLLENDHRGISPKLLDSFEDEFGVSTRPFLRECFSWLEISMGEFSNIEIFTKIADSTLVSDFFISDSLEVLKRLPESLKNQIIEISKSNLEVELSHRHPKNKLSLDTIGLESFLMSQFGRETYEVLFKSFLEKLLLSRTDLIPVKDHRKVWAPLYFPESILWELTGEKCYERYSLECLKFLKPKNQSVAGWLHSLIDEISHSPLYTFIEAEQQSLQETLINAKQMEITSFLQVQEICESFGLMNLDTQSRKVEGSPILLAHYCIDEEDSKVIFDSDPQSPILRQSISKDNSRDSHSNALFELGGGDSEIDTLTSYLKRHGQLAKCEGNWRKLHFSPRVTKIDANDWELYRLELKTQLEKFRIDGPIPHPEATSFNDHLVRGLSWSKRSGVL